MEKKYVIKNFEDGTYLQQDREGWGEDFTMCEFDSLELAVDMVALQPYGNFTIEIIYKKLKIMEKKQSSIDYFFEEVVKWQMKPWLYASDGLEPIIKQAKAMHNEEIERFNKFLNDEKKLGIADLKTIERIQWYYNTYFNETFGGDNE